MGPTDANAAVHLLDGMPARLVRARGEETIVHAAKGAGVSSESLSKWERGLTNPTLAGITRLALWYGTTVDRLLGMGE